MKKLKVVFIGGLTNGKIVFDYLQKNKFVELCLAITYADDYCGARHCVFPNNSYVRKGVSANDLSEDIREIKPDLILVAGWSELLEQEILEIPSSGVIGFHPSKLPADRGRSVLAWQIEEGYNETALSLFYYNDFPDGGDIIAQQIIPIEDNDYINDILDKIDKATYNLIVANFPLIRQGINSRKKQNLNEGNFRRLRTCRDSVIDWNQNASLIYNKIRAISRPYPGAEGVLNSRKLKIWRAEIVRDFPWGQECQAGSVIATLCDKTLIVRVKDCFMRILEWEQI